MQNRLAPLERTADAVIAAGAAVVLLFAVALSMLPGIAGVPPIDRDEPRYTQATKQMLETGDFVNIRFQESPRNKKPIGIHWLQVASATVVGDGAQSPLWVYRVPSALGAIAAMLLAVWAARAFLPFGPAAVVGLLVGATVILGVEARLAKTDAVLLATVVAMQGALARVWLEPAKRWAAPLVFWFALALGILVKGPIAPMVGFTTIAVLAVFSGRSLIGRLRPVTGLLLTAAICLPWFVAIYISTDGAFFANALGDDFLGKAATGQEGHWGPPLMHLALFFAVAWPLSAFTVAALPRLVRARGAPFLFAAAWVIPSWIIFEVTPTKLPHYTLPLVPGIALAVVATLRLVEPPRWSRRLAAVLVGVVPVALLAVVPFGFAWFGTPLPWAAIAAIAVAAVTGVFAAAAMWTGRPLLSGRVVIPAVLSAAVAQGAVWGLTLPALEPVWVSTRLVAAAREVAPCEAPRLLSTGGYNEPSMIFLAGTDTGLIGPEEVVPIAAASPCAVIAARDRVVPRVLAAAEASGTTLREAAVVEGFNISKGDPVRLVLFVAE
jgi:4-amino-4-deoxy-L-arabinose transferase-like glycosyltransferase